MTTKEDVQIEFTNRVRQAIAESKTGFYQAGGLEKLRKLADRMKNAGSFSERMTSILNEVIRDTNYDLSADNKQEFTEFIKPTVADLMKEYLRN